MDAKIIPNSIRDVLDYDPETGVLTWKVNHRRVRAGSIAGWLDSSGYRYVGVEGSKFKAHRIAWFLYHGEQPPEMIDHINRDRADNRIANLRSVTRSQNMLNQGKSGVTWQYERSGMKYATAVYRKKSLYCGTNVMVAHYRRIMAERADHPIALPAPDGVG